MDWIISYCIDSKIRLQLSGCVGYLIWGIDGKRLAKKMDCWLYNHGNPCLSLHIQQEKQQKILLIGFFFFFANYILFYIQEYDANIDINTCCQTLKYPKFLIKKKFTIL